MGVDQEYAALREASAKILEMERRLGVKSNDPGHMGVVAMLTGYLYTNVLCPTSKKHVLGKKDALTNLTNMQ